MQSSERRAPAVDVYAGRSKVMNARRPSSAPAEALEKAMQEKVAVIEASDLIAADRRLAELGYVQVCTAFSPCLLELVSDTLLLHTGLPTRILVAIVHILCSIHLRPIRQCRNNIRIPALRRRRRIRRMVLVDFWRRMHVHCAIRRRARFRLSHVRRTLLHLQIPCTACLDAGD